MTTLFQSIYAIIHSEQRRKFKFSIFAILLWLTAIMVTFLSDPFVIPFGNFIITGLLAFSALMAIASMPRRQASKATDKFAHGESSDPVTNN